MWRAHPHERQWPAAPQPFMDEALGSWLGRVAARYRISVARLAREQELLLGAAIGETGWMEMSPLDQDAIEQVAWLARVNVAELQRIQTPESWLIKRSRLSYCKECLFLNPFDVTAPRWLLEWLNPAASVCRVHGTPLLKVPASVFRQCANMDGILKRLNPGRRYANLWEWHGA